jgi:regulation of enolase protein 1 (concanavalin A-like superfamily)
MDTLDNFSESRLSDDYFWLNKPDEFKTGDGLEIWTMPHTDFWQRTHYGFRNDNGHCLFREVEGDFSMTAQVEFHPGNLYDQCGLMFRVDENNWIKVSTEYIGEVTSKLGSVVTNQGYSDWATQDISSDVKMIWYRVSRRRQDFLLEFSRDGAVWQQLRICHLHEAAGKIAAGIYACSPLESSFWCRFYFLQFAPNQWQLENH